MQNVIMKKTNPKEVVCMKKIILLLLLSILCFCFCSCFVGGEHEGGESGGETGENSGDEPIKDLIYDSSTTLYLVFDASVVPIEVADRR